MSLSKIGRLIGMALVLVGLFLTVYAGLSLYQTTSAERYAESRVPGQDTRAITPVPTLAALATEPPAATIILTTFPTDAPTKTVVPSVTPHPATLVPSPNSALQKIVGAQGLPKGQGANPVRLVIPRMKLDTRIKEATWEVLDENGQQSSEWQIPFDAVGHLVITAKPGEAGNAVISGHHNLIGPNAFGVGLFAGLWNLQDNDPVYIADAIGRTFLYQVQKHYTLRELDEPLAVREQHAQELLSDDGTPIVTFETCWNGAQAPLSGNTYRWIVVTRLVGTVNPSQIPNLK